MKNKAKEKTSSKNDRKLDGLSNPIYRKNRCKIDGNDHEVDACNKPEQNTCYVLNEDL
jgi:hypothetical protein